MQTQTTSKFSSREERVKQYIIIDSDSMIIFKIPRDLYVERLREEIKKLRYGHSIKFSNGLEIEPIKVFPESEWEDIKKYGEGRFFQKGIRIWINEKYIGEFGHGKLKSNARYFQ